MTSRSGPPVIWFNLRSSSGVDGWFGFALAETSFVLQSAASLRDGKFRREASLYRNFESTCRGVRHTSPHVDPLRRCVVCARNGIRKKKMGPVRRHVRYVRCPSAQAPVTNVVPDQEWRLQRCVRLACFLLFRRGKSTYLLGASRKHRENCRGQNSPI